MYKLILSFLDVVTHPLNKNSMVEATFRVIWWKINQLFFKIPSIVEIKNGIRCICYTDSSYGGLVVYKKLPEYYEMNYIYNNLSENDVFIDIGANIGAVTLLGSSKVGNRGKVYSFEPDINVYPRLVENIKLNNCNNVTLINSAVSDKNSSIMFVNEKASEVSHLAYSNTSSKGYKVNSQTLDSFVAKNKIGKVKMIKIDVEGAEMKVLLGMKKTALITKYMVVEVNINAEKYGYSWKESIKFIKDMGFEIYFFTDRGEVKRLNDSVIVNKSLNILAINKKIKK